MGTENDFTAHIWEFNFVLFVFIFFLVEITGSNWGKIQPSFAEENVDSFQIAEFSEEILKPLLSLSLFANRRNSTNRLYFLRFTCVRLSQHKGRKCQKQCQCSVELITKALLKSEEFMIYANLKEYLGSVVMKLQKRHDKVKLWKSYARLQMYASKKKLPCSWKP